MKIRDMALCALFAAVITVCSWITIPAAVPFTMQTFAVFLAGGLGGGKRAAASVLVYVLLGAAGLPVFHGFTGGIGILLGSTGGYILGFIGAALTMWLFERLFGTGSLALASGMAAGLAVCYIIGSLWFAAVYVKASGSVALGQIVSWCVAPFVLPDLIKLALALLAVKKLKKYVPSHMAPAKPQ
ncbi:MAG: biotin transporter BioY [Oscillospiraceae bacterium]